jgi:hypothetical protein
MGTNRWAFSSCKRVGTDTPKGIALVCFVDYCVGGVA